MKFIKDDLKSSEVRTLLSEHQERMADNSPPESRHVLDVSGLQKPDITFWSLWHEKEIMGCVALKQWHELMGEIKSMKTSPHLIRQGIGKKLLLFVIEQAKLRGYQKLKLETGSMSYFEPARKLYQSFGFKPCDPFGHYVEDPNNVFMELDLSIVVNKSTL